MIQGADPDNSTAWPEAKFVMVPDAGHSALEPGIKQALIDAVKSHSGLEC